MKITVKDIENKIHYLNKLTGQPETFYRPTESSRLEAQAGHYFLQQPGGGGYRLCQLCEGGGETDIIGIYTRAELHACLSALIMGFNLGKEAQK